MNTAKPPPGLVYDGGAYAGHCQLGARVASACPRVHAEKYTREGGVGGFCMPSFMRRNPQTLLLPETLF